jgi:rsbT co-antagonist protein RsbR
MFSPDESRELMMATSRLPEIARSHEQQLLTDWMRAQLQSTATRRDLMNEAELEQQSREFLRAFTAAAATSTNPGDSAWGGVKDHLARISNSRARQGFSSSETATFVFSIKEPLFSLIRSTQTDAEIVARETWTATKLLDALGLYTTEVYQRSREEVIARQQQEMLELSTPVVTLWDGVLALPLIGTLDSARTQVVMESLLQRIVDTGSLIAILDITGVPTVDTLVAQHLLKTVSAARLMGADCIISGIRPQIAQTIVHLGVDLNSVTTKATLADAFGVALRRLNLMVTRTNGNVKGQPAAPAAGSAED